MPEKEPFHFHYSAPVREALTEVRARYGLETPAELPATEEVLARYLAVEKKLRRRAKLTAVAVGVIGTLIFGGGLSMILTGHSELFGPGIPVGVAGLAVLWSAYPLYNRLRKKQQKEGACRMLSLDRELLPPSRD